MKTALLTFALILLLVAATACTLIELPPPRSNLRDIVVDEAVAQVDRPYRYQGNRSTGFDASGLVQYVFARSGIELPHSAESQRALGHAMSFDQARRGDLLFFVLDETQPQELHVGIYVGNSRMVHIRENGRVQLEVIDAPYWQRRLLDAISHLP